MEDERIKLKFMQLVAGLQSSAWMMMGKIANPLTGKIEKNLSAAKETIDTLLMLEEKTKGNLSKEEEDFINNSVQQLEINYIEEVKKRENASTEKKEEEKVREKKEEKTETKEKEEVKEEQQKK
jgi:hypothetical protein